MPEVTLHKKKGRRMWVYALLIGLGAGFLAFHLLDDTPEKSATPVLGTPAPTRPVTASLYFCDPTGRYLRMEERVVQKALDPALFARELMEALLDGPQAQNIRCLPEGTRLLSLFRGPENVLYADLSREFMMNQPGSAWAEYLSVCSIVNTLTLNVQEAGAVKILVEGHDVDVLNHVEVKRGLTPNMLIIR